MAEERTEDWFTENCRDPEFVKAYLAEQQEMYDDDLRSAVAAQKEKDAAEIARLMFALGEAAATAANEVREDCGESIAQRVFHAVKAVARAAIRKETS
jgi:nucleoside diphosphate kinase